MIKDSRGLLQGLHRDSLMPSVDAPAVDIRQLIQKYKPDRAPLNLIEQLDAMGVPKPVTKENRIRCTYLKSYFNFLFQCKPIICFSMLDVYRDITINETFMYAGSESWSFTGLPDRYLGIGGVHCISKLSSNKVNEIWPDAELLKIKIERTINATPNPTLTDMVNTQIEESNSDSESEESDREDENTDDVVIPLNWSTCLCFDLNKGLADETIAIREFCKARKITTHVAIWIQWPVYLSGRYSNFNTKLQIQTPFLEFKAFKKNNMDWYKDLSKDLTIYKMN